jgi:hypothetical protein
MNKTNLIRAFGLWTILCLFVQCQKENTTPKHLHEEAIEEHIDDKTISRVSLSDLADDTTFKELTNTYELDELLFKGNKKSGTTSKIDLQDGNFLIPDTINKIERDNYVSYTFLVKNKSNDLNPLKNLVLEKAGEKNSAYYINYELDKEWKQGLSAGSIDPPRGKVWLEDFNGNLDVSNSRTVCRYITIAVIIPCGCGDYYMSQCDGCSARTPRYPNSYLTTFYVCSDNETDLDLFAQNDDGGFGSLGGSGAGSGSGSGDGDTMMNLPVDELIKAGMIFRAKTNLKENINLSTPQIIWLDNNGDQVLMLNTLLVNNEYSQLAKSTIANIIDSARSDVNIEAKITEIEAVLIQLEPKLSQSIPRSRYMERIVGINNFLRTHGHEGLAEMMDDVIVTLPGFSNQELYDLYSYLFDFAKKVQASFMVAVIMPYAETIQLIVEFALIDTGIYAGLKILEKVPALFRSVQVTEVISRLKTSTKLAQFKYAQKFGFKSYTDHDKFFKALNIKRSEKGIQIHHLIEQRFASRLGISDTGKMQSIVLTVEEHKVFTTMWRNKIGYRGDNVAITTTNATADDIYRAAEEIYIDYPEILLALGL